MVRLTTLTTENTSKNRDKITYFEKVKPICVSISISFYWGWVLYQFCLKHCIHSEKGTAIARKKNCWSNEYTEWPGAHPTKTTLNHDSHHTYEMNQVKTTQIYIKPLPSILHIGIRKYIFFSQTRWLLKKIQTHWVQYWFCQRCFILQSL